MCTGRKRPFLLVMGLAVILAGGLGGLLAGSPSDVAAQGMVPWLSPEGDNRRFPTMAYNSKHDEYLLIWVNETGIVGVRLNSNGRPKYRDDNFNVIVIPIAAVSTPSPPALTYSETYNEYLLVWSADVLVAETGLDLYVMVLDGDTVRPKSAAFLLGRPSGIRSSPEIYIPPAGNQIAPVVTYNPHRDEYLAIWCDDRNIGATGWDLFAQRLDGEDKSPKGPSFALHTGASHQTSPTLAYSSREEMYLVAWSDDRNLGATGWDLFARRLEADGNPRGLDIPLFTAGGNQISPVLAYNPYDNYHFVVWSDDRGTEFDDLDIFGMRLNGNGRPIRRHVPICEEGGNQTLPALGCSMDDDYVAIWGDDRDTDGRLDIYGRRLNGNGIPFGSDFPIINDQQLH
ncbi:MAG TPA: hypothetical protein EYP55_08700 [Anaerolineae bacterium]|nr:hypothetical protein [Anaerolineae bacterium]